MLERFPKGPPIGASFHTILRIIISLLFINFIFFVFSYFLLNFNRSFLMSFFHLALSCFIFLPFFLPACLQPLLFLCFNPLFIFLRLFFLLSLPLFVLIRLTVVFPPRLIKQIVCLSFVLSVFNSRVTWLPTN